MQNSTSKTKVQKKKKKSKNIKSINYREEES